MNDQLNSFLGDEAAPAPAAEPTPPPVEAAEPDPIPAEPAEPAEPDAEPAEPQAPEPKQVPVAALQAERKERQDWKEKALRYEGERQALLAQLEDLKKAPPPAPVQQQPAPQPVQALPPPNPVEDPQGFVHWMQRQQEIAAQRQQEALFNERLNNSEAMLRSQKGDADVNAKMEVFKAAVAENPALRVELARQVHPYEWAYNQAAKIEAMKEVGTDPAAYRARIEAELRAKWEAERGAAAAFQAPPAPPVNLPGSLATARSASAARSGPVYSAEPTPLSDLFPTR